MIDGNNTTVMHQSHNNGCSSPSGLCRIPNGGFLPVDAMYKYVCLYQTTADELLGRTPVLYVVTTPLRRALYNSHTHIPCNTYAQY